METPVKPSSRKREPQRQPPIYSPSYIGDLLFVFGIAAMALFVWFAWFLFNATTCDKAVAMVLGACWVVGLPIYFFLEHVYFFRKWGDPTQYDQFKRLQDLAAKVWAGSIVVLAAFFQHTFPGK